MPAMAAAAPPAGHRVHDIVLVPVRDPPGVRDTGPAPHPALSFLDMFIPAFVVRVHPHDDAGSLAPTAAMRRETYPRAMVALPPAAPPAPATTPLVHVRLLSHYAYGDYAEYVHTAPDGLLPWAVFVAGNLPYKSAVAGRPAWKQHAEALQAARTAAKAAGPGADAAELDVLEQRYRIAKAWGIATRLARHTFAYHPHRFSAAADEPSVTAGPSTTRVLTALQHENAALVAGDTVVRVRRGADGQVLLNGTAVIRHFVVDWPFVAGRGQVLVEPTEGAAFALSEVAYRLYSAGDVSKQRAVPSAPPALESVWRQVTRGLSLCLDPKTGPRKIGLPAATDVQLSERGGLEPLLQFCQCQVDLDLGDGSLGPAFTHVQLDDSTQRAALAGVPAWL